MLLFSSSGEIMLETNSISPYNLGFVWSALNNLEMIVSKFWMFALRIEVFRPRKTPPVLFYQQYERPNQFP